MDFVTSENGAIREQKGKIALDRGETREQLVTTRVFGGANRGVKGSSSISARKTSWRNLNFSATRRASCPAPSAAWRCGRVGQKRPRFARNDSF